MGFLLMFDLSNQQSFLNVRNWMNLGSPDIVLVGTKADLQDTRDVQVEQARDLAARYGISYLETSTTTGVAVDEAVCTLLGLVMKRMEQSAEPSGAIPNSSATVSQEVKDTPVRRGCDC